MPKTGQSVDGPGVVCGRSFPSVFWWRARKSAFLAPFFEVVVRGLGLTADKTATGLTVFLQTPASDERASLPRASDLGAQGGAAGRRESCGQGSPPDRNQGKKKGQQGAFRGWTTMGSSRRSGRSTGADHRRLPMAVVSGTETVKAFRSGVSSSRASRTR